MYLLLRALFLTLLAWVARPGPGYVRADVLQMFQEFLGQFPPGTGLIGLWVIGVVFVLIGAYAVGLPALVGLVGALVLPWAAELTPLWKAVSPFPAWTIVPIVILGTVIVAYARAAAPTFRSKDLRVTDGGDHLAIETGSNVTFLKRGFVLCERTQDMTTKFGHTGGTRVVLNPQMITTYGTGGVSHGTVMGTQVIHEPVQLTQERVRTGKADYRLAEVGQDHSFLTAKRPADVEVVGRHDESHRGAAESFQLSGWADLRFDAWRRVHSRLFYRPDRGMVQRIARAAAAHRTEMKYKFGKFKTGHFVLDHNLNVVSFVGLSKDTCFVDVTDPPQAYQLKATEMDVYVRDARSVTVPGLPQRPIPTGQAGKTLEKWAKLAKMRKQNGSA